jgi:hypothetical protein
MAHLLEIETFPIVVNAQGKWSHGGKPLHPRVEKLFRENVRVNEDGSYRIDLGRNQSDIEVADVAFFVTRLELVLDERGDLQRVELTLSDGSCEALNPRTLMQSTDNVFYCAIERDSFLVPCRLQRTPYHELALFTEILDDGPVLRMSGSAFGINRMQRSPKRLSGA